MMGDMVMFRVACCLSVLALVFGSNAIKAEPVVPGLAVGTYASVPTPWQLSFDPLGDLYVGTNSASESKIYRVAAGGTSVSEYGNAAIPDPDAVLFDTTGVVGGMPGSVLVGGLVSGVGGRISTILPSEAVFTVVEHANVGNPDRMALDSTGRLLWTDYTGKRVHALSGATATILFTIPAKPGGLAVDSADSKPWT